MRSSKWIAGALALVLLPLASAAAQDTTRGVRIGLTYDPGTRPGLPT